MANRLTIFYTSDTHGYLYPTDFVSPGLREQGLFRMRFPKDGNTLVIDGGDTIQGSPLTYYCHSKGLPMPCARAMNALGYDYVTLGNHDFNYGYETLKAHLVELDAQCLCGNVLDDLNALPIVSYTVHTLQNGMRIGLAGMVTNRVPFWERPENMTHLKVNDAFEAAKNAIEALKNQVDFLIGIYHGGFEKDLETGKLLSHTDENMACKLCEELPFDLLLTGHQHVAIANTTYAGTHIVQTPCNATAYGKIEVLENGRIVSALCTPDGDARLSPWAEKLYGELNTWLDTPIGKLTRPIWPEDKMTMALHGSPIAAFFNAVQLAASGAQLSCTALGNELRGFDSTVTVRDVVASYTYANTLVVLDVTGKILRAALEQCATYFHVVDSGTLTIGEPFVKPKAAHYNYDYFDGIQYTFDLRLPAGKRVTRLMRDGKPVSDDEHFSLVMNNYRATGAGDFECYLQCKVLRDIQTDVSELILNYLSEHEVVQIPDGAAYEVILPDGRKA